MAGYEPGGFRHGGHRRREVNRRFPVIHARRCGPTTPTDRDDDDFKVMVGLRIMCCFGKGSPTLTSEEIGRLLDLPVEDVTRAAKRLAALNYLTLDPESPEDAWALVSDDR